jgi:hypothetical protein
MTLAVLHIGTTGFSRRLILYWRAGLVAAVIGLVASPRRR